jgi:RNA polymerase sigma-70 factor (ECF subfamily)
MAEPTTLLSKPAASSVSESSLPLVVPRLHVPVVAQDRLRVMFDTNFEFVWRSLRRLGVPSGATDDAAQEVFLVASKRLGDIQVGRERSFLFATALRVASNARRAFARRESRHDDMLDRVVDPAPTPDQLADRARARELLDHVLATLDLDLRAVFVLHELEEMSMADIASTLELAPGTVASRLRRARELFRAEVARLQEAT